MNEEQKQYYINNICSICKRRTECNKDKFSYSDAYERFSMRCVYYDFDGNFEDN